MSKPKAPITRPATAEPITDDLETELYDKLITVSLLIVGFGLTLGLWVYWSALEARTFNLKTGKQASTWEAMWEDLGE